jgi:hypothetical protein
VPRRKDLVNANITTVLDACRQWRQVRNITVEEGNLRPFSGVNILKY